MILLTRMALVASSLLVMGLSGGTTTRRTAEAEAPAARPDTKAALGLFTDRNRAVYRRGEVAQVHVAIHLGEAPAAPVPATLDLTLDEARAPSFPLATVPLTLTGNRTLTIDVRTEHLRFGLSWQLNLP